MHNDWRGSWKVEDLGPKEVTLAGSNPRWDEGCHRPFRVPHWLSFEHLWSQSFQGVIAIRDEDISRSPRCKCDQVMDNKDSPKDERDHCKWVHFSTSCDAHSKCVNNRKWMWLVGCDSALDWYYLGVPWVCVGNSRACGKAWWWKYSIYTTWNYRRV